MKSLILTIWLIFSLPASAEQIAELNLADAMDAIREGRWDSAEHIGEQGGSLVSDIVVWHRLRAGLGTYEQAFDFVERNGDWPGMALLKQRAERTLPLDTHSSEIIDYFGDTPPRTGNGVMALVGAFSDTGLLDRAEEAARTAWLNESMTPEAEAFLLERFADTLKAIEKERLDAMLWGGYRNAARRSAARLNDPDWSALARARIALRQKTRNAISLANAVPEKLARHPGLAYERFRWNMSHRRREDAITLMQAQSSASQGLGRADLWGQDRRDLARRLMRAGAAEEAYALAANHGLTTGRHFNDLEWLAGFIALTDLDDPERALAHFQRFRASVETPISIGRAGYWEGRAHDALGDREAATLAYAYGAQFQTSFYGLLAAEALDLPLSPELTGAQKYPALQDSSFVDKRVFKAALLMQGAGERDLAERFFVHLSEQLTAEEIGTMAELTLSLGEPHIALRIAKSAARQGVELPRPYFPVVELGVEPTTVEHALALAIARRESEFDPSVRSPVGAAGLMQVMPGTARDVTRALGIGYDKSRLYNDPTYNATIGTAYLAGLIERFGNNPILVAAGYNAGPGRPIQWLRDLGDPRQNGSNVVDWIEHIPFNETRNYVMRVAESLPVYHARIGAQANKPVRLTALLRGS